MATSRYIRSNDILQRDASCHPPERAPDSNVTDWSELKMIQDTPIDHPATRVNIVNRWHEREVQPFNRH